MRFYEGHGSSILNTEDYDMSGCACGGKNVLIFACSGAADVGALSDRVARKLTKEGKGEMYCTAAVGAGIPEKIAPVKAATDIVTIDGCSAFCAKKILENAGFTPKSYNLETLGFQKGKTDINDGTINEAVEKLGM
jgi:uncharacterized metal-binding protein